MTSKATSVKDVLREIESLDIEDQAYILDILNKRLIESRRLEIAKRGKEAEQAYNKGNVRTGTFEGLWKDPAWYVGRLKEVPNPMCKFR